MGLGLQENMPNSVIPTEEFTYISGKKRKVIVKNDRVPKNKKVEKREKKTPPNKGNANIKNQFHHDPGPTSCLITLIV